MGKGIDCATPLTAETAAAFKEDGYTFVGRYAVPEGSWKALTAEEVQVISDAGLYIVSVFETTADRALGGAEAGSHDGQVAVQTVAGLGQAKGSTIYFAVDFDAQGWQFGDVEAYLLAAKEIVVQAGYEMGVYGSYSVVETMAGRGVASYFWQTLAWSHRQVSSKAQLYQYEIDTIEDGIGVDHNTSNGSAGGWKLEPPTPPALTVEQADEMIKMLSEAWKTTKDAELKVRVHAVANIIRGLAGMEEQN